jgi:LysM repeat protein
VQAVRQAAGGLIYAFVSVVLVLGSLGLALAQRTPTVARPSPTRLPVTVSPTQSSATARETSSPTASETTATASKPASPSNTYATYPTVARMATSTSSKVVQCGPPYGWIHGYTVEPGDTLYRISVRFETTVEMLRQANCKTGTVIYSGERLWVPYMATATPGITIIPTFPSATPTATETPSATATPSATMEPSATAGLDP